MSNFDKVIARQMSAMVSFLALSLPLLSQVYAWTASTQECTPTNKIPPGGRCLVDDQCEFGECCPIYNFCRTQCCTASGGNTCGGNDCHPSDYRQKYCGAAGPYSNIDPCQQGHPDSYGTRCSGNLPANSGSTTFGLCASFRNTVLQNPSSSESTLVSAFSPSNLDWNNAECGCTDDIKALFSSSSFVGYWNGGTFVSACPGNGNPTPGTPATPTPPPCADTPGFTDAGNWPCINWVGYDCRQALEDYPVQFTTQADEDALLANCQLTCANCPTPAPPTPAPKKAEASAAATLSLTLHALSLLLFSLFWR